MQVSIPITAAEPTAALVLCALTLPPTHLFSTSSCNSHRKLEKPGSATQISDMAVINTPPKSLFGSSLVFRPFSRHRGISVMGTLPPGGMPPTTCQSITTAREAGDGAERLVLCPPSITPC